MLEKLRLFLVLEVFLEDAFLIKLDLWTTSFTLSGICEGIVVTVRNLPCGDP